MDYRLLTISVLAIGVNVLTVGCGPRGPAGAPGPTGPAGAETIGGDTFSVYTGLDTSYCTVTNPNPGTPVPSVPLQFNYVTTGVLTYCTVACQCSGTGSTGANEALISNGSLTLTGGATSGECETSYYGGTFTCDSGSLLTCTGFAWSTAGFGLAATYSVTCT